MLAFQNKCKQNDDELRKRIMNQDDSKNGIKILNENDNEILEVLDVDKNEISENSEAMADETDECDTKDSLIEVVLKVEVDDSDSDGQCTNSKRHTRSHSKVAKSRRGSTKSSKSKTTSSTKGNKGTSSTKGNKGIKACHICGKLVHNYKFPYHINKHNGKCSRSILAVFEHSDKFCLTNHHSAIEYALAL